MNSLENKYFDSVLAEMQDIIKEANLKIEGNILKNETKSAKIEYLEDKQLYTISVADVNGDEIGEYKQISAWLFDDTQTAKDAAAVGIDFSDALRKELGVEVKHTRINTLIDLPTTQKGNNKVDVKDRPARTHSCAAITLFFRLSSKGRAWTLPR